MIALILVQVCDGGYGENVMKAVERDGQRTVFLFLRL